MGGLNGAELVATAGETYIAVDDGRTAAPAYSRTAISHTKSPKM